VRDPHGTNNPASHWPSANGSASDVYRSGAGPTRNSGWRVRHVVSDSARVAVEPALGAGCAEWAWRSARRL